MIASLISEVKDNPQNRSAKGEAGAPDLAGQAGPKHSSMVRLQQNQALAGTAAPFRGGTGDLIWKLLKEDSFRWGGDLLANTLPKVEPLLRWYPIQTHSRLGHNELHSAIAQEFFDLILVKVTDAIADQLTRIVPEFGEWRFDDYALVWIQGVVRLASELTTTIRTSLVNRPTGKVTMMRRKKF